MPKRITNAYYPHFSAFDESTRGESNMTVISNGKLELADLDLEEYLGRETDHTEGKDDPIEKDNADDNANGSNSNTENMSIDQRTTEGTSVGSTISMAEKRPGEVVSWSESEGSTYVSEESESSHAVPPSRKVKVVRVTCIPDEKGNGTIEPKSTQSRGHSELFDVDLGKVQDGNMDTEANEIKQQDSTSAQRPSKQPYHSKHHRDKVENTRVEQRTKALESKSASPSQPKKTTLAEEAAAMLKELGHDVWPNRGSHEKCSLESFPMSYSSSPPNTPENSFGLENIQFYSDVDQASTNDGLSAIGFISKEATRPIFCRRLIPLEIPVCYSEDEVSAVSTVNGSSVMPYSLAGDNTEHAVHTRLGVSRREGLNPRIAQVETHVRLDNVDYLSTVDVASNHLDISTADYKMPYAVAHGAFDRRVEIPAEIPMNDDQDEISTIHGSVTKILFEVHIPSRQDSLSSLDSMSSNEVDLEAKEIYGDGGSDDAVRPAREERKISSGRREKKDHVVIEKDQKKPARHADKLPSEKCENRSYHPAKQNGQDPSDNSHKHKARHADAQNPKSMGKAMKKGRRTSETPPELQDASSTDARIRELKTRIKNMQTISELNETPKPYENQISQRCRGHRDDEDNHSCSQEGELEKNSDSNYKGERLDVKSTRKKTRGKSRFGEPKTRHRKDERDGSKSKNPRRCLEGIGQDGKKENLKAGFDGIDDRLKLYNVDHLENVENAFNNKDISTVDVLISEEVGKYVFGRQQVPFEVPVDCMEDVSTIHYEIEESSQQIISTSSTAASQTMGGSGAETMISDVENGLQNQSGRLNRQHTESYAQSKGRQITPKKVKREVMYYLGQAKEQVGTQARKFKQGTAATTKGIRERTGPQAQKVQASLTALWKKYMGGRSVTEKMIIAIVALSFFVLFILLFVVIGKK